MIDNADFQVRPVILRPLVFRAFLFIVISGFLFFTINVNYYLLGYDMPSWILWVLLIFTFILLLIDWVYTLISNSNAYYVFYPDRVQLFRYALNYSVIDKIELKNDFFDKLMNTKNIVLYSDSKRYYVKYVSDADKIFTYLNSKIASKINTKIGTEATFNHKL